VLQLRAVVGVPLRRSPSNLQPGDPQAGVAPHDGDLDGRWGSSNARITEGISGWERVCEKIIEANGTIVLDENFRTGRRARKIHGEGDRKTKLRKREGKSTLSLALPIHPALMGAYEILMGFEGEGGTAEVV